MNVFILSPLSLEFGRGGEISSMELATGLNKAYNVTIFDTNRVLGEKLLSKMFIREKLKDFRRRGQINFATMRILNKYFDFPYPWEILKLFREIKRNDIIYSSISNFKIDLMLMIFSLIHRRAKFVIGYRKPLYSDKLFSLYNIKYRLSILFFSLFKKRFYHHALSNYAKEYLLKFYEPNKIIHIIHGIDLERFKVERSEEKRFDTLNFIYVGQLDDVHKGVGILIKSIRLFLDSYKESNVFFEFCGVGPLKNALIELESEFPNHVKYNGYISNNDIAKYYCRNDIFLFSSRREPFPRVLMEALASKLVILCSKTIGSIELLKGKKFAFFIEELHPNDIKEKIGELYDFWKSSPEKFKALQDQAKEFVFKNYSIERELDAFCRLFERIMKESN